MQTKQRRPRRSRSASRDSSKSNKSKRPNRAKRPRHGGRRARRPKRSCLPQLLLGLVLAFAIGGLALLVRRHFFSAQFDELPTLRSDMNDILLNEVPLSDTASRSLTRAEKEADVKTLLDILTAFQAPSGSLEEANPQAASTASGTFVDEEGISANARVSDLETQSPSVAVAIDAPDDAAFYDALNALISETLGEKAHLLSAAEVALASRHLGVGFYDTASPYAHVLQNSRVSDRAARMQHALVASGSSWNEAVLNVSGRSSSTAQGASALLGEKAKADPLAFPTPRLSVETAIDAAILQGLAFEDGAWREQAETLKTLMLEAAAHDVVIFDLRHAGGSSTAYWAEGIVPYLVPQTFGMKKTVNVPSTAGDYLAYLTDAETMASTDFAFDRQAETTRLEWTITTEGAVEALAPAHIVLLTDAETGGAAETFVEFLRQLDTVTHYGEPTAGSAWRIPDFLYALPHSGFVLSVSSTLGDASPSLPLTPDTALSGDLMRALLDVLSTLP